MSTASTRNNKPFKCLLCGRHYTPYKSSNGELINPSYCGECLEGRNQIKSKGDYIQ